MSPDSSSSPCGATPSLPTKNADRPATFCNPLPLPDYPVGRLVRDARNGDPIDRSSQWRLNHKEQFRELADPTAVWHEGKWYLYPSVDMAWVSEDQGATWRHHPLNIRDVGYAPTVVKHQGRFLLLASNNSPLFISDSPLGPFETLGPVVIPEEAKAPEITDPMLFSDDDGRLFLYWGCTPTEGIWAVELDASHPTQLIGKPFRAIPFRPDLHPWERVGDWNQNPNIGWIEGAWMLKRNGIYYLTYSAAGTEHRTYAMGCYTSKSPLGPFLPQKRNPILRTPDGLITGTAHGCIVAGPGDDLWAFYCVRAAVAHGFERRVGFDRAEFDADNELFVPAATSTPQWAPGSGKRGDTGWLPLNLGTQTLASSCAPNLPGRFATDNELRTWWQPAEGDTQPVLSCRLMSPATIRATRVIWRDVGLDTNRGVHPGPFRYRIEGETSPGQWTVLVDRGASLEDLLVDYRECTATVCQAVRLVILGTPAGISPGVAEFTVFGNTYPERPTFE